MNNDWRIRNQKDYLNNEKIKNCVFHKKRNWDHEHCEFCWEKILPEMTGFCTEDEKYWICKTCFKDFKDSFNWTLL